MYTGLSEDMSTGLLAGAKFPERLVDLPTRTIETPRLAPEAPICFSALTIWERFRPTWESCH